MIVDSHAHLNDERFANDFVEVLNRSRQAGVKSVIVPGYQLKSSERAVELSSEHPDLYAAVGISPHDAKTSDGATLDKIRRLASSPRCAAIGEIGLDYYYDLSPRDIQLHVFREHLALARELNKPVIVHLRHAAGDLFQVMREDGLPAAGGVLHCFTGTAEEAEEGLRLGLHVSFSGILVFARSEGLRQVAASIPMDRLLVETDSPYLAPPPWRGKRNEPAYITSTLATLAELRGVSVAEMAAQTSRNACALFQLDDSVSSE